MSEDVDSGGDGVDSDGEDELTYAEAGVDIDASEAATSALIAAAGEAVEETAYAGMLDMGEQYLGLATDGVGTKLLVAEALADYSTIGIDCVAMNANDLIAAGLEPVAFVDYLAVDEPSETFSEQVGQGIAEGVNRAGCSLLGGETAVMPDVITGLDLAGTCAGIAPKATVFPGEAESGDALVGWPSSGIHSNGLTLAREAVTREYEYTDPFPPNTEHSIGEELLEPTRIYADLLEPLWNHDVHACAHVTGGGWGNLERMGEYRYAIDDPFDAQPIFEFVQELGGVSDAEMHTTFNMGTGFVASVASADAESLAGATEDGRIIGRVESGEGVAIRGLEL